jgi:hypothetical protein
LSRGNVGPRLILVLRPTVRSAAQRLVQLPISSFRDSTLPLISHLTSAHQSSHSAHQSSPLISHLTSAHQSYHCRSSVISAHQSSHFRSSVISLPLVSYLTATYQSSPLISHLISACQHGPCAPPTNGRQQHLHHHLTAAVNVSSSPFDQHDPVHVAHCDEEMDSEHNPSPRIITSSRL